MLYAFGDDRDPLNETVRVLDEIVTDYIIETAHTAARIAEYSGRTKLKVDDFKFAIRRDDVATGRVKELLAMEKDFKDQRKGFDMGEGRIGLERGGRKKKEEKGEDAKADVRSKFKAKAEPMDQENDLDDMDDE